MEATTINKIREELKELAQLNNITLIPEGTKQFSLAGTPQKISLAIYPGGDGNITYKEALSVIDQLSRDILGRGKRICLYINTTDLYMELSEAPEYYPTLAIQNRQQLLPHLDAFYQAD